jgi:hypothetical protein
MQAMVSEMHEVLLGKVTASFQYKQVQRQPQNSCLWDLAALESFWTD